MKKQVEKDKKTAMIGYKITNQIFARLIKLGKVYGMGPHECSRMLTLRELPVEEKKNFGKVFDLKKSDVYKSNLSKETPPYKGK